MADWPTKLRPKSLQKPELLGSKRVRIAFSFFLDRVRLLKLIISPRQGFFLVTSWGPSGT